MAGLRAAVAVTIAAGLVGALAPAASAGGGSAGAVIARGACSGPSEWKLKGAPDNGRIQVEYEVDAVARQRWHVTLADNGRVVADVIRVAGGRSLSFTVRALPRNVPNRPDMITARAVNLVTGERCGGSITVRG